MKKNPHFFIFFISDKYSFYRPDTQKKVITNVKNEIFPSGIVFDKKQKIRKYFFFNLKNFTESYGNLIFPKGLQKRKFIKGFV